MKFLIKKTMRAIKPILRASLLLCLVYASVVMGIATMRVLQFEPLAVPSSMVITSTEGKILASRIAADGQWRLWLASGTPKNYAKAVTVYEDKRFYHHFGIDLIAASRAAYQFFKYGKITSGASTITMQLARLILGNDDRTLSNKFLEMAAAMALEMRFSKNKILQLYSGMVPFHNNIIGIHTAAYTLFDRPAHQLTWAQACQLAVTPQMPSAPPDEIRSKRNFLLTKLFKTGILSSLEFNLALQEPLGSKRRSLPNPYPHLLNSAYLKNPLKIDNSEAWPGNSLISTSIHWNMQEKVSSIAGRHAEKLADNGIYNLAVLILDNESGQVLAYLGNRPNQKTGSFPAERGIYVDVISHPRSTGSLLKPFLFAHLIEEGELTPNTILPDAPIQFSGYGPKNFDLKNRGMATVQEILTHSLNIPSVHALKRYGIGKFMFNLRHWGISTLSHDASHYGLALILGGAEGNLWEITRAYQKLYHDSLLETRRSRQYAQEKRIISAGSAYLILQILTELTRPDEQSLWHRFTSRQQIAWKTGTSIGFKDAWSVGISSRFTVGVWTGNADGTGRSELIGIKAAAPLMFDIFNALPKGSPFKPPLSELTNITVCKQDGFLPQNDCPTKQILMPRLSNFTKRSPYYHKIFLSEDEEEQVYRNCLAKGEKITQKSWFILPPANAWYYEKANPSYRFPPPYRKSCAEAFSGQKAASKNMITLAYPRQGARLKLSSRNPNGHELSVTSQRLSMRANHQLPMKTIFWHLNDTYLGKTVSYHELTAKIAPGNHLLRIVDEDGNSDAVFFHVF